MIDIQELEEGVLIEAGDFNMGIQQLIADITVRYRDLSKEEIYKLACNVIGSLVVQEFVTVIKTTYKETGDDIFSPVSNADVSGDELDTFLKEPAKWDELDVFSKTETFELKITEAGRNSLFG
ncbi:MAG: hypothetical protein GY754_46065 [bacterium]|nr:hypothetical protein [bacterium]